MENTTNQTIATVSAAFLAAGALLYSLNAQFLIQAQCDQHKKARDVLQSEIDKYQAETKADADVKTEQQMKASKVVAVIGDIGGTNIRLKLVMLNLQKRTSHVLKKMTTVKSNSVNNLSEAINNFIEGFTGDQQPAIGVIGIAGSVKDNQVLSANLPNSWPNPLIGETIGHECKINSFQFLNDFEANGYGICQLRASDCTPLNRAVAQADGVKAVLGPGTGLGEAILMKSKFAPYHEVFAGEGSWCDFAVKTKEDFELMEFAQKYLEESNNVENLRAKKKVTSIATAHLCAGPAVPLIYEFLKARNPDLPLVLETATFKADQIESWHVINAAKEQKDPLCMKVVQKFIEILAIETGNFAMKVLPYGGVYVLGGVANGIAPILTDENDTTFIDNYINSKEKLVHGILKDFPINLINADVDLGVLGAEEYAYRVLDF